MFNFTINNTVVAIFSKFFSKDDKVAVLEGIPEDTTRVLFVDTASTPVLVETIKSLRERVTEIHVRDHHRGEGRNPEAAEAIEAILGGHLQIVTRAEAPGCAQLVELGEFGFPGMELDAEDIGIRPRKWNGTVIIADPDYDGLIAAMKAAGVNYDGMDSDAEIFDVRPSQSADTLTPLGWTAVRALATLPLFNKDRPEVSEKAKMELFQSFVNAAEGDAEALASLESRVAVYEAGVEEAKRLLAEKMTQPHPGAVLIDSVGAQRSDLNTLTKGMESEGAIVTVVRKDFGPIAGKPGGHGIQYSLAVVRDHQKDLDLRDLVPEGAECSPQAGLLSNVAFLLHCSEGVWEDTILPALRDKLAD